MSADDGYAFLDCGGGRRLERFGGIVVSRPAPAALRRRGLPDAAWDGAALSFSKETGWRGNAPAGRAVRIGGVAMTLRPAGGGQLGVFPEHAVVAERVLLRVAAGGGPPVFPLRALNLFAHTGLATLMFAASGKCAVAHVDASPAAVKQARENAALSGLADAPVRWLVDDALQFLRRERRRDNRYDIILADPPSFGRAGKNSGGGRAAEWKFDRDLPALLALSKDVLDENGVFALTCHSEGRDGGTLSALIREHTGMKNIEAAGLTLVPETRQGAALPAGNLLIATAI